MLVVHSLVVVLTTVTCTTACLSDCYCGQLGPYQSVMVCNNLDWTHLPSNLSTSLQAIDFSNNQLDLLSSYDFQGMHSLKSVELQCNNLRLLPTDVFEDAEQLQMVDLSFNSIEYLPAEVFSHNNNLDELYLKQNPLSTPSGSGPLLFSSSLTILDISFCGITTLQQSSFRSLKKLKSLNIAGNNISALQVDVLRPLRHLEKIHVSSDGFQCNDAHFQETLTFLRKRSVTVISPEICTSNNTGVDSTERESIPTANMLPIDELTNETFVLPEIVMKSGEDDVVVMGSSEGGLREGRVLPGVFLTDIAEAVCLLLAVLVLMVLAIRLLKMERRKGQTKIRPPMPLPNRYMRESHGGVYSVHEYARPILPAMEGEEDHYSEVRSPEDEGYLAPREAPLLPIVHTPRHGPPTKPCSHYQPLLARPVYCGTTVPVPDVVGQVQAARTYLATTPRPSLWA